MPIYEYRCERGHQFEVMQKMTDDPVQSCARCEAPVQRVFHPVAVHFKGKGFYNTDYGTKNRQREKATRLPGHLALTEKEYAVTLAVRAAPHQAARLRIILRETLEAAGFELTHAPTTVESWLAAAMERAKPTTRRSLPQPREGTALDPQLWPRAAGSWPGYVFTDAPLSLAAGHYGLGHGTGAHAPDEYYLIESTNPKVQGLDGAIASFVEFLYDLS
jgi:putative FmdB family regulatory protein